VLLIGFAAVASLAQNRRDQGEHRFVVVKNGRYGYIDYTGKIAIPAIFLWGDGFEDGVANVYVCGRHAWIDRSGRIAEHRPSSGNEMWVRESGGKFGFTDENDVFRIPPVFDEARHFTEGVAPVRIGKLWGFIDQTGRMAIQTQFEDAFWFIEGVGAVDTAEGAALIDKTGRVLATGYEFTEGIPAEGLVPASHGDKAGYLDLSGKVAIPFVYDWVGTFRDGLAQAQVRGKWGYIDHRGHAVIPFQFDSAGEFAHGLAPVRKGSDSGFINSLGQFVFHLQFTDAAGFQWGELSRFSTSDNRFGYVNTDGKVVWGPVPEAPDHAPLFGWTKQDKDQSCKGIPNEIRLEAERLPAD
jgi:hypothetical protein